MGIVAYSDLGYCDSKYEHEIRIVTDGNKAVIWIKNDPAQMTACHVEGTGTLQVACKGTTGDPAVSCWGETLFDLTEGSWTADPDALKLLNLYGEEIEE